MKAMNRKNRSIFASLVVLALFGVLGGCRETPITSKPNIPTVFVGEINGIVRDGSTGAPLNNVTVTLLGTATDAGGANPTTTTTDANGLYVFRNLDAGTYKIAATAPAGYAATRVLDGVELVPRTGTNEAGVVVTRVARDIRFFTANGSVTGTATFNTPQGANLPIPAGTPVFVDFALADGDSPAGRTVGDVQVSLVRDTVRANGLINITGLPAVGALADAGEVPRLVIPNFIVGGVVYGGLNGRAITVNLTGLRGATPVIIQPNQLIAQPNFGPTTLLASSTFQGGASATAYGTTDSILFVFNKPMQPATVNATITRTRTPYSTLQVAATVLNGRTVTPLPAGTYLGVAAAANQAYVLRLNRPFVTGSDHEVGFTGVLAADGSSYNPSSADRLLRIFTTRTGVRLLSTSLDAPAGLTRRTGVPVSGTITITTAVPAGATLNPVILRGPNRNLEVRTGDVLDAGALFNRDFPITFGNPTQSVDSVAQITGGTITFGYTGLTNTTADPRQGTTGNVFHIAPTRVDADAANAETPLLNGATNATNRVPGNIRSTVPGDFGIERAAATNDPNREYNLVRVFETSVTAGEPIQIVSRPTTNVPTDTLIQIRFTRAITLPASDTLRGDGATGGAVRLVRIAPGTFVTGTAAGTLGSPVLGAFANNVTVPTGGAVAGDSVRALSLGYRANLADDGRVLQIRRLNRLSDGTQLPLETGTSYAVDLQIAGLATGVQGNSTGPGEFIRLIFTTRPGISVASSSPTETIPGGSATTGSPRTGQITINFNQPLAPEVQFFTRGLGANIALLNVGSGTAPVPDPPTAAALTTIRNNAIQGLPPQGGVDTRVPLTSIDCVGVISADRRSVTFNYTDLPADRRFRVVAFHANASVPFASADAPRVFTLVNGIAPNSVLGVIRSEIPGDLGIGGPNTVYRNQVNFTFNTNTQAPTPAIVIASNASGNLNFDPLEGVTLTFSRPMKQSQTGFTIEKVGGAAANSQTHTAGVNTPPLDTLRWSADGRTVTIRRVRVGGSSGDTTRAFEAGVFYRISPTFDPDSIQTTDGGALIAFQGITFRTLPATTITAGTVSALDGTTNVRSLNTGSGIRAVGDTAGRITLTFSNNPAGFYNVRGPIEKRFVFGLLDTTRLSNSPFASIDLTTTNGGNPTGGILGGNLTSSAFIDSTVVLDGNTMRVNYYVSSKLLRGRGVLPGIDTATRGGNFLGTNTFVVEFRPNMTTAADGTAPLQVFTTTGPGGSVRSTAAATSHPSTLRSARGGDFGVVGVDTSGTISAIRNTRDAFDFQFIIRPGASGTPSSFPDMVVSAINNAVETVSDASKKAVRTVRSWWKRVTE